MTADSAAGNHEAAEQSSYVVVVFMSNKVTP